MSQWFKRSSKRRTKIVLHIHFCSLSNNSNMTAVFHTRPYGRFIEIKSNLQREKLRRMNQCCNFLGGGFSNGDNVRAPIQIRREG